MVRGREHLRRDAIATEERGSRHDPSPAESDRLLARIRTITDEADGSRVLAAARAGRCPTCGQSLPVAP